MMETFPVDDNFDEFIESMTNSYDFLEESTEESTEESIEESTEESIEESVEESIEESIEEIIEESEVVTYADSDVYDDSALLDTLSVTNGLLSALLFCFVAKWCVEIIKSGVRRLMKNA